MSPRRIPLVTAALAALATAGCATWLEGAERLARRLQPPFAYASIDAPALRPGPGERIRVDQALLLVDATASISAGTLFPRMKTRVGDFAAAMPDGSYAAGLLAFGGARRTRFPLMPFERERMEFETSKLLHYGGHTPLGRVFDDAAEMLAGRRGHAAVVLFSDGDPTGADGDREDPETVIEAARELLAGHAGTVCFHTVQVGGDPAGERLLREIAELSACGSFRPLLRVNDARSLLAFERDVFVGLSGPADADLDGVVDAADECPGTPRGARVDARGCWVIEGLHFAFDRSEIQPRYHDRLDRVVSVLERNAAVAVRVEGHTDARGSDAYNEALSERRARAVRDYLVARGIDPARLRVRGFGESRPIAPNDTESGRARNRRVELTPI